MAKPTFEVQPQRSDGRGFMPCDPHRATSFAVIRVDKFTKSGRKFTAKRVIGRYNTKTQAEGAAEANRRSFEPTARHLVRKLGLRIISNVDR